MAKKSPTKIPGRFVSLSIRSPRDMYRKLEWEASQLDALDGHKVEIAGYCTLNAAVTAWHLGDWTAAALDERRAWEVASRFFKMPMLKVQDLQQQMRKCKALVACQQMNAAMKHMTIQEPTLKLGYIAYHWAMLVPERGLAALSNNPLLRNRLITTIAIKYPSEIDGSVEREQTLAIRDVLDDVLLWWEKTLRGLELWNDQ